MHVCVSVCVHVCGVRGVPHYVYMLFLSFYVPLLIDELGEVSLSMCGFVAECRHRCLYPGQRVWVVATGESCRTLHEESNVSLT